MVPDDRYRLIIPIEIFPKIIIFPVCIPEQALEICRIVILCHKLIYFAQLRGVKKANAKKEAQRWLERLHVKEYEHRKLETLSKGNQQKIQLIQTLICNPDSLFVLRIYLRYLSALPYTMRASA